MKRQHNLWRYAPWMARDYFLWAGVATVVLMLFVGLFATEQLVGAGSLRNPTHPFAGVPPKVLAFTEAELLIVLTTIGPLIATTGIIANDYRRGYFRLLLARPMSRAMYYAEIFAINGVGFLIVSGVVCTLFSFIVAPLPLPRVLGMATLGYLFLGGVIFLLSALWRYELLAFIATYVAAAVSWDLITSEGSKGWLTHAKWAVEWLPPVHVQAALASLAVVNGKFDWERVVWVGGYGAVCLCCGFVVLLRKQYGTAG